MDTPTRKNEKAPKLDAYFKKEGLDIFHKSALNDAADTILFLSAIPAGTHRLLCAIITDCTVYTVVRCQLGSRIPHMPGEDRFLEFIRRLNAEHALFKYAMNETGTVYLDVCLPASAEHFDPEMVRTTMNLLVYHLKDTYDEMLKWLDKAGDADSDISG